MKFNKLILGLAAAPLILASCSNKITYEQAKQWVADHYTKSEERNVYTTVDWDYHASVLGDTAVEAIQAFFADIRMGLGISEEEYLPFPGKDKTIGSKRIVEQTISLNPLNSSEFEEFNKDKCTFKIVDNALTVIESGTSPKHQHDYSRAYAYNQEGYMTGFGQKLNKLKINDQNIIKITVTIDFEYAY